MSAKIIRANPGPQENFLKSSADITIYGGAAGGGKLIDINEPILTSNGWKKMGDIQEGDYVYARDGKLCMVMAVSDIVMPDECYEFTFSNGYKVISGADHLWITSDIHERKIGKESAKDSKEIFNTFMRYGRFNHYVKITNTLEFKEKNFPNDLYNLGRKLVKTLREPDRVYEINEKYKYSSKNQRLDFLRGCASVHGSVSIRGKCTMYVYNKYLMDYICEIIDSLGIKRSPIEEKRFVKYSRFYVRFYTEENIFLDEKRKSRQKRENLNVFNKYYYICGVKKVAPTFCKCIGVNSSDNSYLIGKSFIPTHNTFALLLDAFRYAYYPNYVAVIFRREMKQVTNAGGLWDKALDLYTELGGEPNMTERYIRFPYKEYDRYGKLVKEHKGKGGKIHFSHLNEENDKFSWQGAEIPYIAFDELTHFTLTQFLYMLTRNRNSSKYKFPNLIRATCNPDPDSWVRDFLDPWIDKETGLPIPGMETKTMYVVVYDEKFYFEESSEKLIDKMVEMGMERSQVFPKSMRFIPSKLTDNPYLSNDTGYVAGIRMNDEHTANQLLEGNWNEKPALGIVFKINNIKPVSYNELPLFKKVVRGWDFAGGKDKDISKNKKFDNTASVKLGLGVDGYIYVLDCTNEQIESGKLINKIREVAEDDTERCIIRIPQDPGQAGMFQVHSIISNLMEFAVKYRTMKTDKTTRANVIASKVENGFVRILEGNWNKMFLNELDKFPPVKGSPDVVDALVEAFHELSQTDNFTTAGCYVGEADE